MEGLIHSNDTEKIQIVKKMDVDEENNFSTVFSVRSCENSGTQIFGNHTIVNISLTNQFCINSTSKEQSVGCLGSDFESDFESDSLDGIADGSKNGRQLEIERASNVWMLQIQNFLRDLAKIANVPFISEANPPGLSCTSYGTLEDEDIEWFQSIICEAQKLHYQMWSMIVSMIAILVWLIVPYIAYPILIINCCVACIRCLKIKFVKPLKGGIGDISGVFVWFGFGMNDLPFFLLHLINLIFWVFISQGMCHCAQCLLPWFYIRMIIFIAFIVPVAMFVYSSIRSQPTMNKLYKIKVILELQIQQNHYYRDLMKGKRKNNHESTKKAKSI